MPDERQHRGRHPEDDQLFAPDQWPALRAAVADLSWLLARDYAAASALKVVGDRYQLAQRQRIAVARCSCSDQARASRLSRRVDAAKIRGHNLAIDGFNVLTTIEAALAGGVLLLARDGCLRDMASVHGTYRKVEETAPAVELIATSLAQWQPARCLWYLDAPVSNSGRLATILRAAGARAGLAWEVELVDSPDRVLASAGAIVATADSVILDRCGPWVNFTSHVLAEETVRAAAIDLACP
jgi:hypothetical protein